MEIIPQARVATDLEWGKEDLDKPDRADSLAVSARVEDPVKADNPDSPAA